MWYCIFIFHCSIYYLWNQLLTMMTSSNGNIFRVTGHLCGEFTGLRWLPSTKASDAKCQICVWINGWVNNREAGDLRRYRTHYYVTVMNTLPEAKLDIEACNLIYGVYTQKYRQIESQTLWKHPFDTLRWGQHFTDDIENTISWNKFTLFWFKIHWGLFVRDRLVTLQHVTCSIVVNLNNEEIPTLVNICQSYVQLSDLYPYPVNLRIILSERLLENISFWLCSQELLSCLCIVNST